jgi:hypothetical protein
VKFHNLNDEKYHFHDLLRHLFLEKSLALLNQKNLAKATHFIRVDKRLVLVTRAKNNELI